MKAASALIHLAVEPKYKSDQTRLAAALRELEAADIAFQVRTDRESGQTILGALGEPHLQTKLAALRHDYQLDLNLGAPQVAYRETIARRVEIDFTLKQMGGERTFARVKLSLAPRDQGQGNAIASGVGPGLLPENYVVAIERGVESVLRSGILAGFPVVDISVSLTDCACHERDSSAAAFECAARNAMRDGLQKGGAVLLQPVMALEISVPTDALEVVLVDLRQRRGIIGGQEISGATAIVSAIAPLAQLFGYSSALHSLSGGRASHSMQFNQYAAVPSDEDDGPYPAALALRMPPVLALGDSA
ncbi:hypothetical protein [Bosea sp. (in: a-proteobacteria)]|jgi:elongation factor G|uniref:hypothetical protein n=1 Tax=Bosea sp. (in: a-proteobacteria) TaxID=1871050 RepID=UPI003F6EA6E3